MSNITNKEETVVELTGEQFNALVEKRARAIVKERCLAPRCRLSSLAGDPRILNRLRDREGNFREPTKEELRDLFGPENIKELAGCIIELHMGTKRSEAVLGDYQNYLLEEFDRTIADYNAEPTE